MNWIWQTWKCPEWCHLLVSMSGVRLGRTLGLNPFLCIAIVFFLGFLYEVIIDYLIKKSNPSLTDLIADGIGCLIGVFI